MMILLRQTIASFSWSSKYVAEASSLEATVKSCITKCGKLVYKEQKGGLPA